jgi:hypothetical protein
MRKLMRPTSQWGFGTMIHAIHVSDDVPKLNAFYEDVFGGLVFMGVDDPSYLPPEKRLASLLLIGDLCVETMAPEPPVDTATPVGRFYERFRSHWHSIGYTAPISRASVAICKARASIWGSRAGGVMVECCKNEMRNDPRLRGDWSSLRKLWQAHPLGVDRLGWVTIGVRDIDEHLELWERLFEVVPVHAEVSPLGHLSHFVHFGDILVELAMPTGPGTAIADHVARNGDMIYGITLKVVDLDRAARHLDTKGIRTTRPDGQTLVAATEDTRGAPRSFTTRSIPNDPFD